MGLGDTEGERLFLIRAALGRGIRKPMPQRDFAELLAGVRGRSYDASKISMIEQGKQRMSIDDAEDFAAVDPEKRGAPWVVFGIVTAKGKAPADLQAEADENARRLKTGEPLITRDAPGAPAHPPRVHEDDRHLYETLKDRTERKKRGRRKRA